MARRSWLDESGENSLIDEYARQTGSFIDAMADGKIEENELNEQEARVIELMKKIEPKLDDAQHAELTELLCEMTSFNVMQMVHMIHLARPKTQFQG
jgi:hypothetical protein